MFSFIRRHWVAYLIAAAVALALGFGLAYFVGVKGSLPADVKAERIAAEKKSVETNNEIQGFSSSDEEDDDALDDSSGESDSADASGSDTDATSETAEGEFQDVDSSESD